jgi:hypothetical protein
MLALYKKPYTLPQDYRRTWEENMTREHGENMGTDGTFT